MAAVFYMEPLLTYDVGVFVSLPEHSGKRVSLSPIYTYLQARGCSINREHVVIEGVPVQFLPVFDPLTQEALHTAREVRYKGARTRVFRAEHLAAIMLATNRPTDKVRLAQFLEEAELDRGHLMEIIERHGLMHQWLQFTEQSGLPR